MQVAKISKPFRLTRAARRRKRTIEELIAPLIAEHKSVIKVAQILEVAPNTVRYHLDKLGYSFIDGEWRKGSTD
jgi:predicted ArsR family transcriptional regulator